MSDISASYPDRSLPDTGVQMDEPKTPDTAPARGLIATIAHGVASIATGLWRLAFPEHVPIETVAEAQRRASRRLPRPIYLSLIAATEKGLTLQRNVSTFDSIGLWPRVATDLPAEVDMRATLLGVELSMPVIVSPAGVQAVDPGGEVAAARAAASAGTAIGLSNFASRRFDEVAQANPKAFYQAYWSGSRDDLAWRLDQARQAGAKAVILTLDASSYAKRDWGTPAIPTRIDLETLIRYAPMGLSNPRWLLRFLLSGQFPDLSVPNLGTPTNPRPTFVEALTEWAGTPPPTWEDVAWMREQWGGPFMVKGILTPDDARRAVDAGATAISVSNHGGNNLDGSPSPLRILPAIREAVGDQLEIACDSGFRRGSDVVKALALGADVVLIGRAWLFGLAAGGERGVREVLDVFRAGIDKTVSSLGHASIRDIRREDLVVPDDFVLRGPGRG